MGKCSAALLVSLFVFLPVVLFAQTPENPVENPPEAVAGHVITSIEVIGLKRTRTKVTDYALGKFIGRDAKSLDLNEVKAAVIDTGVLEPVSVEFLPEDGRLIVHVEEKWSFLPLPMVTVNSGGTNFGLFIADTNAFGLRDQAAVGGMYGSDGWMGMVMYRNTPERDNFPGWNTAFMYSRREKEEQNRKEQTLRGYEASFFQAAFGLEYPFTRKLNLSLVFSFTDIQILDPVLNAPEEDSRNIGFSLSAAYRSSSWDGYLLSERSLSLSYGYMPALVGSSFHELGMGFVYALPIVPGFLVSLKGEANAKLGAGKVFEDSPRGVNILPAQFSTLHYAGALAGLEKYLFKTRYGTLSAFASWQAVVSSGSLSGEAFDHGPAGGIRFYLSRIAIPALGFTVAYNMTTSLPQFSFNLGMGF
jgi:hypothetical protein